MKIYSRTFFEPDIPLDFDIDLRAKTQMNNFIFSHNVGSMEDFTYSMNRSFERATIDENNIKYMNDLHLPVIVNFVFSSKSKNELSEMIINAISNFADALSTKKIQKRIAEIFTIYESLLVPNNSSPILDSLTKYGPKLITNDSEERKELKKLFQDFYAVRSSLMHHGLYKSFDMEGLRKLQFCLLLLIIKLIELSQFHQNKSDVLLEIDEAINRA